MSCPSSMFSHGPLVSSHSSIKCWSTEDYKWSVRQLFLWSYDGVSRLKPVFIHPLLDMVVGIDLVRVTKMPLASKHLIFFNASCKILVYQ